MRRARSAASPHSASRRLLAVTGAVALLAAGVVLEQPSPASAALTVNDILLPRLEGHQHIDLPSDVVRLHIEMAGAQGTNGWYGIDPQGSSIAVGGPGAGGKMSFDLGDRYAGQRLYVLVGATGMAAPYEGLGDPHYEGRGGGGTFLATSTELIAVAGGGGSGGLAWNTRAEVTTLAGGNGGTGVTSATGPTTLGLNFPGVVGYPASGSTPGGPGYSTIADSTQPERWGKTAHVDGAAAIVPGWGGEPTLGCGPAGTRPVGGGGSGWGGGGGGGFDSVAAQDTPDGNGYAECGGGGGGSGYLAPGIVATDVGLHGGQGYLRYSYTLAEGPSIYPIHHDSHIPADVDVAWRVQVDGAPFPTVTATGLPPGLSFDAATGYITGKPTTLGEFDYTIRAANGWGTDAVRSGHVTVGPGPARTLLLWPSGVTIVQGWSQEFSYTAMDRYDNDVPVEGDPVLTSNDPSDIVTGDSVLFMTPGVRQVQASTGDVAGSTLVTVTPMLEEVPGAASAVAGDSFTADVTVAGTPTPTLALSGELPDGVLFDAATGRVSGTPTEVGTFTYTVTATNLNHVSAAVTRTLAVVASALEVLTLTPSVGTVMQGGSLDFTVAGVDAFGNPVDVGGVTLSSDVPTDIVDGMRVTFPHASPHTITATADGGVVGSVVVEVQPAASPPDDQDDGDGPDGGGSDDGGSDDGGSDDGGSDDGGGLDGGGSLDGGSQDGGVPDEVGLDDGGPDGSGSRVDGAGGKNLAGVGELTSAGTDAPGPALVFGLGAVLAGLGMLCVRSRRTVTTDSASRRIRAGRHRSALTRDLPSPRARQR